MICIIQIIHFIHVPLVFPVPVFCDNVTSPSAIRFAIPFRFYLESGNAQLPHGSFFSRSLSCFPLSVKKAHRNELLLFLLHSNMAYIFCTRASQLRAHAKNVSIKKAHRSELLTTKRKIFQLVRIVLSKSLITVRN